MFAAVPTFHSLLPGTFPSQKNQKHFQAMASWDYATVDETVEAFIEKWENGDEEDEDIYEENDADEGLSKVEKLMSDLYDLVEEDTDELPQGQAEARLVQALNVSNIPVDDILLALFKGSSINDIVRYKTYPLLHRVARRFLAEHPGVRIPSAFQTAPAPWRPVVGDDYDNAEMKAHEAGMHYIMARAAGVECSLPWEAGVVPPADYRGAVHYLEDEDLEDFQLHPLDYPYMMTTHDCNELLQKYTNLVLNIIA